MALRCRDDCSSTLSVKTPDELSVCRGCRQRFHSVHRRPMALQCLHCFCEQCILGMVAGKSGRKVECPVCRTTTKLEKKENGKGNILPINYAILELMSAAGNSNGAVQGNQEANVCNGGNQGTNGGKQGANFCNGGNQGANVCNGRNQGANVYNDGKQGANVCNGGNQGANVYNGGNQGANVYNGGKHGANDCNGGNQRANVCNGGTGGYSVGVGEKLSVVPVGRTELNGGRSCQKSENSNNKDASSGSQSEGWRRMTTNGGNPGVSSPPPPSSSIFAVNSNGTTSINVIVDGGGMGGCRATSLPENKKTTSAGKKISMVVQTTKSSSSSSSRDCVITTSPISCNGCETPSTSGTAAQKNVAVGTGPAVTSLSVNSSSAAAAVPTHRPAPPTAPSQQALAAGTDDLCSNCHVYHAALTLANATEMKTRKICSNCYSLMKQQQPEQQREHVRTRHPRNVPNQNSDAATTTVIKIQDEQQQQQQQQQRPQQARATCHETVLKSNETVTGSADENYRGSVHVDGIKSTSVVYKKTTSTNNNNGVKTTMSAGNVADDTFAAEEEIPKPEVVFQFPVISTRPSSYQARSTFQLRTDEQEGRSRVGDNDTSSVAPCRTQQQPTPVTSVVGGGCTVRNGEDDFPTEFQYDVGPRPLPFNPEYVETACSSSTSESSTSESPILPPLNTPLNLPPSSIPVTVCPQTYPYPQTEPVNQEKQPPVYVDGVPMPFLAPPAGCAADYSYPAPMSAAPPPRYEEVVTPGNYPSYPPPSTNGIRLLKSFGKYGELATQPGAFRSPTRINVSSKGVVVVCDQANRTVQAFSRAGECLAIIRPVNDVNGCCCYDVNKLAMGTNSGIQIYDFNGSLRKNIPTTSPVVNTIDDGETGFLAVQSRALSLFRNEVPLKTIRDKSRPGQAKQSFDNIADAAINSQKDIVVLDAGAAAGLGCIYVLSDDGFLKSTIVPGKEPCGALKIPTAVAVDQAHNVLVSDSGNKRVLLFGANGKFQRQLLQGQPGVGWGPEGSRSDPMVWPAGMDVGNDDRLFVVARGDKFAEIRVFTY